MTSHQISINCLTKLLIFFLSRTFHPISIFILCYNWFLKSLPGVWVNRMSNIVVFSIIGLSTRHCYKKTFVSVNNLNVMNHKLTVNSYGGNCLKFTFLGNLPDSDVFVYFYSDFGILYSFKWPDGHLNNNGNIVY